MTTAAPGAPAAPAAGAPAATPAAPAAPTPGSPEYNAAMAEKGRAAAAGGAAPAAAAPSRPEWLPEKFTSPEDLAKAYKELESKLGQQPAKPAAPPTVTPAVDPAAAAAQVAQAGLDFTAVSAEFAEKGALSPETYAKLQAGGIDKATVDLYIEGQKAVAEKFQAKAATLAGDQKKLDAMIAWAGQNFTQAEANVFNEATKSGDEAKLAFAINGLKARYEAAEGSSPALLTGGNTVAATGYQSTAQMTADMKKPEYKTDPAFRAQVAEKLRNAAWRR